MDILKNKILSFLQQKRSSWIFFAFSALSCLPLFYLFLRFKEAGFGYDIGFYRYFGSEYFKEIFNPKINPFAFSSFSDFVLLLGDSLNSFLITWYIILSGLSTYAFAILIRKRSGSLILSTLILIIFSSSIIQFEFFSGFYYRNLLALFLMFTTLLLLEYETYLASLPLLILSAIHPLTSFVFAPALFITGIFQKEKRILILKTLFIAGIVSLFFSWNEFYHYTKTLFGFLQNKEANLAQSSEFTGQFISSSQFFYFSLPYLPFTLIGIFHEWKKQIFWSIFGLLNLCLIIFQFFLFERFYLFLNITFIFFAGYGLLFFFEKFNNKKIFYVLLSSYILLLFSIETLYICSKAPLIPPSELKEIQSLSDIIPQKSFLLSFSSSDATWLYGFTKTYKIIAPGMLDENKWTYDQWQEFWFTQDTKKRADLLSQYNTKEIYIYVSEPFKNIGQTIFSNDPHIQAINSHLWKYQFSP